MFCPGILLLSMFVCAAVSLSFTRFINVHVSAAYVIAGSTHVLYTLQASSKVILEDIAMLVDFILVSGAVSLS